MTAAQDNSTPAATGAESEALVTTTIIGRAWRRVKAWALARIYPAKVEPLIIAARCPVCKREIDAGGSWLVWDRNVWHVECLGRRRGWDLRAEDPADVLPDRSVTRYQPDAREPGFELPSGTTVN